MPAQAPASDWLTDSTVPSSNDVSQPDTRSDFPASGTGRKASGGLAPGCVLQFLLDLLPGDGGMGERSGRGS